MSDMERYICVCSWTFLSVNMGYWYLGLNCITIRPCVIYQHCHFMTLTFDLNNWSWRGIFITILELFYLIINFEYINVCCLKQNFFFTFTFSVLSLDNKKEGIWCINSTHKIPTRTRQNPKQRNSAFIAVLHLKVTVRPSTWSKRSQPTASSRRPLAPV